MDYDPYALITILQWVMNHRAEWPEILVTEQLSTDALRHEKSMQYVMRFKYEHMSKSVL